MQPGTEPQPPASRKQGEHASSRHARRIRLKMVPYLLLAPALLYLLAVLIYPLIFSLLIAFRNYQIPKGLAIFTMPFVGWRNFGDVLGDPVFQTSLRTTGTILVAGVGVEFCLGFGLALLLNRAVARRASGAYLALMLTPLMIPPVVSGLIWRMMLNVQYGIVTAIETGLGLPATDWLGSTTWALPSLILVDIWQWTPLVILILLAGLRTLPVEVYEAATIDGVGPMSRFFCITVPLMRWTLTIVLLLRVMDTFKLFDYAYSLTSGGPGYATETVSYYAFLDGFSQFDLGHAAAASWLIFAMVYVLCLAILFVGRRRGAVL
jgi:multiple sugar transport system permease protein